MKGILRVSVLLSMMKYVIGIPGDYVLQDGDIINVDATTGVNGYYADASRMFMLGHVSEEAQRLVKVTKECLEEGMRL